jgi:hypothetical protein
MYRPFYSENVTPWPKKYSVYVMNDQTNNKKLIHFGDARYEQFHDKLGKYSHLDHEDPRRRALYRKRHRRDNINNMDSPAYWSWHFLW